VAVERAYVWDNTSVIVDEVLAHRIGLIPLNVDPALLDLKDREFRSDIRRVLF
jgi:DNA-directed RNA polymerase I and III subunit RPAC1